VSLFADGALYLEEGLDLANDWVADAGVGLTLRGRLLDRDVRARVDFPVYVSQPFLAIDRASADDERKVRFRYTFSLNDLW
jgi:hypothetical protein